MAATENCRNSKNSTDFNEIWYTEYFGYGKSKYKVKNYFRTAILKKNGRQNHKISNMTDFNEIWYTGYFGYGEFKYEVKMGVRGGGLLFWASPKQRQHLLLLNHRIKDLVVYCFYSVSYY